MIQTSLLLDQCYRKFNFTDLVFVSDEYNGKIYSINMMMDNATILVDSVARRMALGK